MVDENNYKVKAEYKYYKVMSIGNFLRDHRTSIVIIGTYLNAFHTQCFNSLYNELWDRKNKL